MAKKIDKKETRKGATVYIGKPLKGLPRFMVFAGGKIPDHIAAMLDDNARGLIVPVADLQKAREDLHVKGNILNYFYTNQK